MRSRLLTYGAVLAGPVGTSAAHFLVLLASMHLLRPRDFGSISFLLVLAQFTWSAWSALFSAPLPVLLESSAFRFDDRRVASLLITSSVSAGVAAILYFVAALILEASFASALCFAAFGLFALFRLYARTYCYALSKVKQVVASDLAYCASMLSLVACMWIYGSADPFQIFATLALAAILGCLPLAATVLSAARRPTFRSLKMYSEIWQAHTRWSLRAAITMELTANAHTYLVTFLKGPAAFSIIAATSLMSRPVSVIMNGLTDYERVRLAKVVSTNSRIVAFRSAWSLRILLLTVWAGTSTAAIGILLVSPQLLFPPMYEGSVILIGTVLWLLVMGTRAGRTAETVLMESSGRFRSLANASLVSAICSLAAVAILTELVGVLWSIAGIVIGELVYAVLVWRSTFVWVKAEPLGRV